MPHRLRSHRPINRSHSSRTGRNRFQFRRTLRLERLEDRCLLATWQNVAISAGGFVDGIFYDLNNQNVIYARTDIGGLYKTTKNGQSWTQLLNIVGNNASTSGNGTQQQLIGVLGFAIDPENSNNIYADVGEYSGTNGATTGAVARQFGISPARFSQLRNGFRQNWQQFQGEMLPSGSAA